MGRSIILVRHGQTDFNAGLRMQGQMDVALSEIGLQQAQAMAPHIAERNPLAIYSSDSQRAWRTADAIAQLTGLPVHRDKRLRETAMGEWTGLSHEQVDAQWPGQRLMWRGNPTFAPPGGESRMDVAARSSEVVRELIDSYPTWEEEDRPIVIVAHGGTICSLTAALLDYPIQNYALFGTLRNTAWCTFTEWPIYITDEELTAMESVPGPRHRALPPVHPGRQWRLQEWNAGVL